MTAFYNILKYYRTQGYNKIPKDNNKMYDIVKKCAIDVGYTKKRGLPVNKNNNLVKGRGKRDLVILQALETVTICGHIQL